MLYCPFEPVYMRRKSTETDAQFKYYERLVEKITYSYMHVYFYCYLGILVRYVPTDEEEVFDILVCVACLSCGTLILCSSLVVIIIFFCFCVFHQETCVL